MHWQFFPRFLLFLLYCWCWLIPAAWATPLGDRLQRYPDWRTLPPLETVQTGEDLEYPAWMAGRWQVTSTLLDQVAPLAPEIVTPGFEQNRVLINQAIAFPVQFIPQTQFFYTNLTLPTVLPSEPPIVADRAFNGLHIAQAYLGETGVKAVKVDPKNPNRQLTLLPGDRPLISTVTARATEAPDPDHFLSSEFVTQQFRNPQNGSDIYLNRVETTTAYTLENPATITAEQVTAIYLSPTDPDFFQAPNQPVALYRYHLTLEKLTAPNDAP